MSDVSNLCAACRAGLGPSSDHARLCPNYLSPEAERERLASTRTPAHVDLGWQLVAPLLPAATTVLRWLNRLLRRSR